VKTLDKAALYENFAQAVLALFSELEFYFGFTKNTLVDSVSQIDWEPHYRERDQYDPHGDYNNMTHEDWVAEFDPAFFEEAVHQNIRNTKAWRCLETIYDYALDGILEMDDPKGLIDSAGTILNIFSPAISEEWEAIVARATGRYRLDHSSKVAIEELALLASIDIRTVRNAISANELASEKVDSTVYVDNTSARNWLSGRRGFKPTRVLVELVGGMTSISNPSEFGSFLVSQRKKLGISVNDYKLGVLHPSLNTKVIKEIEMGVFGLPLDTVIPLADFYQLNRNDFLFSVMKVFYEDQHRALTEKPHTEQEEATDEQ